MTTIVLISTYELGHQPFGLASPAAWLKEAGAKVVCCDLAVENLQEDVIRSADLIAFYLPMHTATRIATPVVGRVRTINPDAHLCFYGLYASVNEKFLRSLGADTILGGEFESGLVSLYKRLSANGLSPHPPQQVEPIISRERQQFLIPDRSGLPALDRYATLQVGEGPDRTVGYTEASRGCKHLCRHCPVVPVYGGRFRIVQRDVILDDIRQQVAAGAQHITFGDPDFFNGPGHAIPLVEALHAEFPDVTYDVTIKIEHLIKHAKLLPRLRDSGCLFVTSAVESSDDAILDIFDKGHTRDDFMRVAKLFRDVGLTLIPTFVTFTPWTTLESYLDLLSLIRELDLVDNVSPIQYAIRLLIPAGSKLLELPDVQSRVGAFDEAALCYRWSHPDPRMDQLYHDVLEVVQNDSINRRVVFERVSRLALDVDQNVGVDWPALAEVGNESASSPIPRLSEHWF